MAANIPTNGTLPRIYECQGSITRPNDSTQYAAGDGIADATTTATVAGYFTLNWNAGLGASVMTTDFTLHKSDHDVTTATFWLLLFDAVPALTGFDDNSALAITDAEMKNCKGVVTFAAADWANAVTGDIQTVSKTIGLVCAAADSAIYGILVAGDTYTPAAQEIFTLTVKAVQG